MAKKQNYGFEKRRKEQDRKAKKDAKAAERRLRRDDGSASAPVDPSVTDAPGADAPLPPDDQR